MLANVNGSLDVAVQTLQSIVEHSPDEQLIKAFFTDSPLRVGFARFLAMQYSQWLVKQQTTDIVIEKERWSSELLMPDEYVHVSSEPHRRLRSEDDQVEVVPDVEYDAVPSMPIERRTSSDSLEIVDVPTTDSDTKSASPPSTEVQEESAPKLKVFRFEAEEKEEAPPKASHAKGNLSLTLNLEEFSDGTIDQIVDSMGLEDEERKTPELVNRSHPQLRDQVSDASSNFLDALVSSTVDIQLESERDRQRREMESLTETQLVFISENMPQISDIMFNVSTRELQSCLIRKMNLCNVRFNMNTTSQVEMDAIEKKSKMLNDLMDFFIKSIGEDSSETSRRREKKRKRSADIVVHWYSNEVLLACLEMIKFHILRPLPTSLKEDSRESPAANDDEADGFEDFEWIHLETIYKILLFIVSANPQIDKKYLGRLLKDFFIRRFMELFLTEDRRERECLKTILHRIYGRFMGIRKLIRVIIANHCFMVVYGKRRNAYGISEFLQILVSVIHGYATPVKQEHQDFLRNVLLPLHKCRELVRFHEELGACMYQFVFKEPNVAPVIFGALLKFWPYGATLKQEILLTEMKNIVAIMVANAGRFDWRGNAHILDVVVKHLTDCMKSEHHMVAQRAISLWADEAMQAFCDRNRPKIWGKVAAALADNRTHWNDDVRAAADELAQYMAAREPEAWQEMWSIAQDEWERSSRVHVKTFALKTSQAARQRDSKWNKLASLARNQSRPRRSRGSSRLATTVSRTNRSRARESSKSPRQKPNTRRPNSSGLVRMDSPGKPGRSPSGGRGRGRGGSRGQRRGISFSRRRHASSPENPKPRRSLFR